MVALQRKPLGLLGWLLSTLLGLVCGDSTEPETPTQAHTA
jgi:hypothetical protein